MTRFSPRPVPFVALAASLALAGLAATTGPAAAQSVTLPPSGGNQRATVVQQIGLVRVSIEYSSPHVHSPAGVDRKGKIWGDLVPYGMSSQAFGTCGTECPWRGGANENTVFTTSHDIKVQGQLLPAGAYGLHFIPGKEEWTIIFSKNSTSWGSFFYNAKEDALRVQAKPETAEYHEVLTYEFPERRLDTATVALKWENLALPFTLKVDNANDLYVENLRRELRSSPGFGYEGWLAASQFCLQQKTHLEEGLAWAERATDRLRGGQEGFTTLLNLADLQAANGKTAEATKTRDRALGHPTASPVDVHLYGRQLLAQKKPEEAIKVFELNAKRHPDVWPVHLGLARGYAALGRQKEALTEAKLAVQQAPDEPNRKSLERLIQQLEEGKAID
jgi:tetratricopeptide (TPR) repeat protein